MKKNIFIKFIFIAFIIVFFIFVSGCKYYYEEIENIKKTSENITITMSSTIKPADINDRSLEYHADYIYYDNNNEYDFYNCFFRVENKSKYDVLDLKLSTSSSKNHIVDYWSDTYCPYAVKSNDVGYISGIISVKKNISESEIRDIVNDLNKSVTISVGNITFDKLTEIEKSFKKSFDIVDEDYSNYDIQYPDTW